MQIHAKDLLLHHLPASRETLVWVDFSFLKPLCKITQKTCANTSVPVTGPEWFLLTRLQCDVEDLNVPRGLWGHVMSL